MDVGIGRFMNAATEPGANGGLRRCLAASSCGSHSTRAKLSQNPEKMSSYFVLQWNILQPVERMTQNRKGSRFCVQLPLASKDSTKRQHLNGK
ncbi:MAG TPA: hypothetical protein VFB72_05970 [Verrucomicrobiae bacterium]|nr:hypothetical protein [Verrucomicrobiae bacterium]